MLFGGSRPPQGWLLCDGSVVLRENFKELFEVIGETYGKGDGHNTFSLPDLRGRIAIGAGEAAGLTDHKLGEQIGSETYNLTIAELPNHAHSGTTSSDGNHNHNGRTSDNGSHRHSGKTEIANRMQHFRVISQTGVGCDDGIHSVGWRGQLADNEYRDYFNNDENPYTINENGNDFFDFANSKHTHNLTTDNKGSHNRTFNTENDGDHEHSIPSEGEGQPYSVMQPSLSLNYIIKY